MKRLLRVLDVFIIVSVSLGVIVNFTSANGTLGRFNLFTYYTIQSNLLMLLVVIYGMVISKRKKNEYTISRVGATMLITITGVGYHLLLSGIHHPEGWNLVANYLLHYIVPSLSFITWLLWDEKTILSKRAPLIWMIFPLVYLGGSTIRGAFNGIYHYWFLDPTQPLPEGVGSYLGLIVVILILGISFLLLSYIYRWINNKLIFYYHRELPLK